METVVKVAFLTAAADVEFHDKWMTSDTWAELICLRFNLMNDYSFTGKDLLKILGLKCNSYLTNQMDVDRRNLAKDHIGIFRDRYKDKTNKKLTCFYACEQGQAPKLNHVTSKWYNEINDGKILFNKFKTRASKRDLTVNGVVVSSNINKRKHEEVEEAVKNLLSSDKPSLPPANVPIIKASEPIASQHHEVYWLSSEAQAIFHPKEDETVLDAIKKQIEILHDALSSYLLITSIIEGDAEDLTTHQIISVRERCQILSLALSIAVDNMPVWKNWNKCCEVAIRIASKMGVATSRNARVVRNWYQKF
jgi:hypothetical protein